MGKGAKYRAMSSSRIVSKSLFGGCLLGLMLITGGCLSDSDDIPEREESNYKRAVSFYKDERYEHALTLFLKIIDERQMAPESHLEAGRIYLDYIKDPVAAIYHFRKYLELKPDVEQSAIVRQMIETAQKAFAKSLPGRSYETDVDRLDLMTLLKKTQDENLQLRKEIAKFQNLLGKSHMQKSKEAVPNQMSFVGGNIHPKQEKKKGDSLYTVGTGDTLSKISIKVYGNAMYWERIYNANRDKLPSAHALKLGQVLKVPAMD